MEPLDFILIHGYHVNEDGSLDKILSDKLDYGLSLYRANQGRHIVVAGKHGEKDRPFVERTGRPESSWMRRYLEDNGVPTEIIYEEPNGGYTYLNTQLAFADVILPNGWTSGHIVSNVEHLPRIIAQTSSLQASGVIPVTLKLFYSGPIISDPTVRKEFIRSELKKLNLFMVEHGHMEEG